MNSWHDHIVMPEIRPPIALASSNVSASMNMSRWSKMGLVVCTKKVFINLVSYRGLVYCLSYRYLRKTTSLEQRLRLLCGALKQLRQFRGGLARAQGDTNCKRRADRSGFDDALVAPDQN